MFKALPIITSGRALVYGVSIQFSDLTSNYLCAQISKYSSRKTRIFFISLASFAVFFSF